MSWLNKNLAVCGRPIPHPQEQGHHEEIYDESISIQDQIENLRAKISLKERYNKALRDDLNESNLGATSYVHELTNETKDLRQKLMDAINSERTAVQNALRTHREFQLAMTNKPPSIAVPWLDDKLFDMAKHLNLLLDRLKEKRKRLEESEQMVTTIQKWPRPGTLPWEHEAVTTFNRLECMIEAQKVKRETAFIIHSKYVDIKYQLLAERGKYTSQLKLMESGLRTLKNELNSLETMLEDAIYFRNETYKNLVLTEKEASENRKRRRIQMVKMKKAVEKILEENQRVPAKALVKLARAEMSIVSTLGEVFEALKAKKAEVDAYQGRARRLVEVMRVPDLTHIPLRLKTVSVIGVRLHQELETKEKLRDLLLKQKAQLQLILYFFRYTGVHQLEEFLNIKQEYQESILEADNKHGVMTRRLDRLGDIQLQLRLGLVAINELLAEGKRKPPRLNHENMLYNMKIINDKLKKMVKQKESIEEMLDDGHPEKNYGAYVKQCAHQNWHIRVGTPHVSEESEEEDDLMDSKVPTRLDLKSRSARIVHQAHLKRGIR